jgi:drug/metabolite transporter (DMT)-like permease
VPIVLALSSAVLYGVADFFGGRASRYHPSVVVTLVGQTVSLFAVLVTLASMGTAVPGGATFAYGALGGVAGAIGIACLYYSFANGSMTVVAPISAVVGAAVPAAFGLATGDRPSPLAIVGMAVAIVAVALVSGAIGEHERPTPRSSMAIAAAAGALFGVLFIAFDRTDPDSGLWPLAAARLASVPFLVVLVLVLRQKVGPRRSMLRLAVVAGVLDMASNWLYLEATRGGLLSLVAVVSSMYPASTITLAMVVDGERANRWQWVGITLTLVALALVALGRS